MLISQRPTIQASSAPTIFKPKVVSIAVAVAVGAAAVGWVRAVVRPGSPRPWADTGVAVLAAVATLATPAGARLFAVSAYNATASRDLGVDFRPFAMTILIAASAGFASPIGYQTHLMVYGPGGYRFSDFFRIGIPMDLIVTEEGTGP